MYYIIKKYFFSFLKLLKFCKQANIIWALLECSPVFSNIINLFRTKQLQVADTDAKYLHCNKFLYFKCKFFEI